MTEVPNDERRVILISRIVLGIGAASALIGLIVLVEAMDSQSRAARLVATAVPSFVGWWCAMRLPSFAMDANSSRPLLRRSRGSHFRSFLSSSQWSEVEASPPPRAFAIDKRFGKRRTGSVIAVLAYGLGAWLAAVIAGNEDSFGDLTDAGLIGFLAFGGLAGGAVRAALRLLSAGGAIRVDRDRVVLGYSVGYLPRFTIRRSDLLAIRLADGEAAFLSNGRRVDLVDLGRFDDPAGVLESLGVADPWVTAEDAVPAAAGEAGHLGQLTLDLPTAAPSGHGALVPDAQPFTKQPTPIEKADPPTEEDLGGAVRQWRLHLVLMSALFLVAAAASALSANWWISQRQANDRLLDQGQLVLAEVVDVDSGRNSSLTVEFEFNDRDYERTIHAGFFREFGRGNLGQEIGVLFDPAHPGLVRTPNDRNMHPMTIVAALCSAAALLAAGSGLSGGRRARRMLASDTWHAGHLSVDERKRRQPVTVTLKSADGAMLLRSRRVSGLRGREYFKAPAKYSVAEKHMLVIPEGARIAALVRR